MLELPFITAHAIRHLLTTSSSLPEQRIAAIDALDLAINDHLDRCDWPVHWPYHQTHERRHNR